MEHFQVLPKDTFGLLHSVHFADEIDLVPRHRQRERSEIAGRPYSRVQLAG